MSEMIERVAKAKRGTAPASGSRCDVTRVIVLRPVKTKGEVWER